MKVILHYGRDLWEDIIVYIIHNRINGIIAAMILALAYGSQIFVTNSRVDTADMVSYQGTTFNGL